MGRDKYYPPELKKRIVHEASADGNLTAVARRYGVSRAALYRWIAEDQQGVLGHEGLPLSVSEIDRMAKELAKAKQLLGEKELEIQILKDLVKKTNQRSATKLK